MQELGRYKANDLEKCEVEGISCSPKCHKGIKELSQDLSETI